MIFPLILGAGDWRVMPGVRIGGLSIGAEEQAALKTLGKPSGGDAAAGHHWTTWTGKGGGRLDVYAATVAKGRPEVVSIRATSPSFRLSNGLGAGLAAARFQRAFPSAKVVESYGGAVLHDARSKGIDREARKGRVVAIIVHRRRQDGTNFDRYQPVPWKETP